MEVLLEFCDLREGTRLHERALEYDELPPIPSVGETVLISERSHASPLTVRKREFSYLSGDPGLPDVKVSFWCEPGPALALATDGWRRRRRFAAAGAAADR